ncbi:hypothetical protein ACHAWF_002508 [Thalassiosira exigua]
MPESSGLGIAHFSISSPSQSEPSYFLHPPDAHVRVPGPSNEAASFASAFALSSSFAKAAASSKERASTLFEASIATSSMEKVDAVRSSRDERKCLCQHLRGPDRVGPAAFVTVAEGFGCVRVRVPAPANHRMSLSQHAWLANAKDCQHPALGVFSAC